MDSRIVGIDYLNSKFSKCRSGRLGIGSWRPRGFHWTVRLILSYGCYYSYPSTFHLLGYGRVLCVRAGWNQEMMSPAHRSPLCYWDDFFKIECSDFKPMFSFKSRGKTSRTHSIFLRHLLIFSSVLLLHRPFLLMATTFSTPVQVHMVGLYDVQCVGWDGSLLCSHSLINVPQLYQPGHMLKCSMAALHLQSRQRWIDELIGSSQPTLWTSFAVHRSVELPAGLIREVLYSKY